jgi:F-type H+-transporting ATPase subunit b
VKAQLKKFIARTGALVALASSVAFALPAYAFAAERETSGINAILPQMDEFIPMLVAFLILVFILAKFGWPAFDRVLVKRETTIKEALEKSEEARQESERVLAEYKAQLEDAKTQAAQIIADAKQTGEKARADITAQAQAESEAMIAKARAAIEVEKKAAIAELQGSVADLSIDVASRLVATDLSDEEHRKIIEHYISEAGSFNAN